MKKIVKMIAIFLFLIFGFSISFANYDSYKSNLGYNTPINIDDFSFDAKLLDNGTVKTSWKVYNKSDKFKYYKVVRSTINVNPVYPEDGYIKYSTDINFTGYIDSNPKKGINYYRVCAITYEKNRYCSNVVKINNIVSNVVGGDKDEHGCIGSAGYKWCAVKNKCIRPWEEKCSDNSGLKAELKEKADKLINNFFIKIEKKYTVNNKRVYIYNQVIKKLNNLGRIRPKALKLINYYVLKIKERISILDNGFNEYNDIFNSY